MGGSNGQNSSLWQSRKSAAGMHIGFLTPEFPGQTHAFIWRERQILIDAGVKVDMVSTRLPPSQIMCQLWAKEAEAITAYLLPWRIQDIGIIAIEWLRAGPAGWLKCLACIVHAEGVSPSQRLKLVASAIIAGKLVHLSRVQGWSHIHVHSCAEAAHVAMFASRLSGITYSLALLGPTLEQYGPNQPLKWKHAAFGLVISRLLYEHVLNVLNGSLPPRVDFAVMAVDTEASRRSTPYEPWVGGRPFTIFSCGRLNLVKGHKYLIEAVELLKNRGLDVHLQVAGEDEAGGTGYRKDLEKLIQEKALTEQVTLLGSISEDQFHEYLQQVDAFAMGSLNEGISVAAMDAMSMELPVVMTRVGGMHELIDSGINGILVPSERSDELADAIAQIMQDPDFALSLSRNSRQKVVEKFDSRLGAKVLIENLEIVMNQESTPTHRKIPSFFAPSSKR